jgi:hypothetical protein
MFLLKVMTNVWVQNKQSNRFPRAVGLRTVDTARSDALRPHSALKSN